MHLSTKRNAFRRLSAIHIATVIDVGVAAQTESLIAAFPSALHLLIEPDTTWHDSYRQTYASIRHVIHQITADETRRIDSLTLNGPALLKIDVDGCELAVLIGSIGILDCVALIVIETTSDSLCDIVQFAQAHRFRLFDIVELCYCGNQLHQCDLIFVAESFCPLVFTPWDIQLYRHFE